MAAAESWKDDETAEMEQRITPIQLKPGFFKTTKSEPNTTIVDAPICRLEVLFPSIKYATAIIMSGDPAFRHWFNESPMNIRLALFVMIFMAKKTPMIMTGPVKSLICSNVGVRTRPMSVHERRIK